MVRATSFGKWLRVKRQAQGLSQEELALRIGVDRTYISKIENGGVVLPELETRLKLHEALGTAEEDLWREMPQPRSGGDVGNLGALVDEMTAGWTSQEKRNLLYLISVAVRVTAEQKALGGIAAPDEEAVL